MSVSYVIKFVKRGGASVASIEADDLAAHEYGTDSIPPVNMSRMQEMELPREIDIIYIDQDFDYQQSTQRSQRMTGYGLSLFNIPLSVVMDAEKAKQVADANLYNVWTERTRFSIALSNKWLALEPTDVIDIPYADGIKQCRIAKKDEGSPGIIKLELAFEDSVVYTQSGDAAAVIDYTPQVVFQISQSLAYFLDIPLLLDSHDNPGFYLAALGYSDGWQGAAIFQSADGATNFSEINAITQEVTAGYAISQLGGFFSGNIFDELNYVDVYLRAGELVSSTEIAVLNGANLAVLGDEIIQFKNAVLTAANTYRLSGLLRGRRGSSYGIHSHGIGEIFVLAQTSSWIRIAAETSQIGLTRWYKTVTFGDTLANTSAKNFINTAKGLECYPVCEIGGGRQADGDITINWERRARLGGEWRNNADASQPETTESYEIELLSTGLNSIIRTVTGITASTYDYPVLLSSADYPAASWAQIGGDSLNGSWASLLDSVACMVGLGADIYAGTGNGSGDAEVWRYSAGAWVQIGGDSLNSGWATGFDTVRCIATNSTLIYAGLGDSLTEAEVWSWNGTAWTKIGGDGVNSSWNTNYEEVQCLVWDGTFLYAGLGTSSSDGEVWRWNGTAWTQIGGDSLNSGWGAGYESVYSMCWDGTFLYAGLSAGASDAEVWRWNGTAWTKIGGDGLNSSWATGTFVYAMTYFNSTLYAAVVDQVWSWNGTAWTSLAFAIGAASSIASMTNDGSNVYIGTLGNVDGHGDIYKYDGSWQQLAGDGLLGTWTDKFAVNSLLYHQLVLYAGLGNQASDAEVWQAIIAESGVPNPLVVDVYQNSASVGRGFVQRGLVYHGNTPFYGESTRWRLLISSNNGNANISIAKLSMYDIYFNGDDQCTGGTPSSSAGTAANAFDNDVTTLLTMTNSGTAFLEYQFALAENIIQYQITCSTSVDTAPKAWKLQRFYNGAWLDMHSIGGQISWTSNETRTFTL